MPKQNESKNPTTPDRTGSKLRDPKIVWPALGAAAAIAMGLANVASSNSGSPHGSEMSAASTSRTIEPAQRDTVSPLPLSTPTAHRVTKTPRTEKSRNYGDSVEVLVLPSTSSISVTVHHARHNNPVPAPSTQPSEVVSDPGLIQPQPTPVHTTVDDSGMLPTGSASR